MSGFFNRYIVSVPYHSTWATADDVLCDAWKATFATPGCTGVCTTSATLTIETFDNVPGGPILHDNNAVGRQIFCSGTAQIVGSDPLPFDLVAGEGYLLTLDGDASFAGFTLPFPHF